ncbi:hypothetical protein Rsub_00681 [Raphidocelis subcapitata]|uniref:Leucine-rich repeat-containing N-terminal plant-type domain-containing protein n=1 Tax=Raphidocelis subcapitata TaxID=307507 RepID=A0A2V0NLJ3_9CHLO|nr:hypothetical protein Rsub_00681 [Raphidocelis subcapitata]|eukprot:GBF87969.1 hypothetical protein Rsub_00681 [Raphidocelis subcapitata]
MRPRRAAAPGARAAAALLTALVALLAPAAALTTPEQFEAVSAFRDSLAPRSANWRDALATWRCPTDPANSDGPCDPCGRKSDGNWEHMHCRGKSTGWGESGDGTIDGNVTNVHITDVNIDGPIPRRDWQLCILPNLREFDLDGGHLTGTIPTWIADCFPKIEELDLSYNRLTGTLPVELTRIPRISEVKIEYNSVIGTIPPEYGNQVEHNRMHGKIPDSFRNISDTLTQLLLAHNDFEGDLSALGASKLMIVSVHNNPKLCGMVPASIRFAKGYNPAGTRLGQPC